MEKIEDKKPEGSKKERDNDFEWNQFIKLGEMMGDGLHHEPDGKWIVRDYNRLAKLLVPEIKERDIATRKARAENIDRQMSKLMDFKKCACGGSLKQKRKGTKVCYCTVCDRRHVAINKKNNG